MAKKTKPEGVGVAATEETTAVVQGGHEVVADPTLLGVQVPLTVTRAALKEVAAAWRACFVEVAAAARAKVLKSGAPVGAPVTAIAA